MIKVPSPFRYFYLSPEVIRLAVMMYIRFPLSLQNVEDLMFERGRPPSVICVSCSGKPASLPSFW